MLWLLMAQFFLVFLDDYFFYTKSEWFNSAAQNKSSSLKANCFLFRFL